MPVEIRRGDVAAYRFRDRNDKPSPYWRDIGTLDAYYEANMGLIRMTPEFNLCDDILPTRTHVSQQPRAKFVFAEGERRMGVALDSIISAGCIVSGGRVTHSVLSPGVRINSYCEIDQSILMTGVKIGRHSRIRRTIVPPGVSLPEGSTIGFDVDGDRACGFTVSESGVVALRPPGGFLDEAVVLDRGGQHEQSEGL